MGREERGERIARTSPAHRMNSVLGIANVLMMFDNELGY
jgi:hypothetical protein